MKKLLLLTLLLSIGFSFIFAAGSPRQKETRKGELLQVTPIVEGALTLYTHQSEIIQTTIPEDPFESFTTIHTSYYLEIGEEGKITQLHCMNYKSVLKTQMSDNPELQNKIGKKGFSFKDLEKIISAYNK